MCFVLSFSRKEHTEPHKKSLPFITDITSTSASLSLCCFEAHHFRWKVFFLTWNSKQESPLPTIRPALRRKLWSLLLPFSAEGVPGCSWSVCWSALSPRWPPSWAAAHAPWRWSDWAPGWRSVQDSVSSKVSIQHPEIPEVRMGLPTQ